jgi:hypothetical protein
MYDWHMSYWITEEAYRFHAVEVLMPIREAETKASSNVCQHTTATVILSHIAIKLYVLVSQKTDTDPGRSPSSSRERAVTVFSHLEARP